MLVAHSPKGKELILPEPWGNWEDNSSSQCGKAGKPFTIPTNKTTFLAGKYHTQLDPNGSCFWHWVNQYWNILKLWSITGWWSEPLWKIWKSVGIMKFPTEWKKQIHVPVTTNQCVYHYQLISINHYKSTIIPPLLNFPFSPARKRTTFASLSHLCLTASIFWMRWCSGWKSFLLVLCSIISIVGYFWWLNYGGSMCPFLLTM